MSPLINVKCDDDEQDFCRVLGAESCWNVQERVPAASQDVSRRNPLSPPTLATPLYCCTASTACIVIAQFYSVHCDKDIYHPRLPSASVIGWVRCNMYKTSGPSETGRQQC